MIFSSSSEPSTLSNALALATGDLGEVARRRFPDLTDELTLPPENKMSLYQQRKISKDQL